MTEPPRLMTPPPRRRRPRNPRHSRELTRFDVVVILIVVAAIAGMIAWVIANAGGGHNLI